MKTPGLGVLLGTLLAVAAHGATSDILFHTGEGTFNGAPGNIIFNGQHFVTPVVRTNNRIFLTFLDTNAVAVSNQSMGAVGSSPRIVTDGSDYLMVWLNPNEGSNTLSFVRISAGFTGPISLIATNVAEESVSLSRAGNELLVVWQNPGSNSTVLARAYNLNGLPVDAAFAVAPSALPQRYPSVDNDGANHLVCWMEQNVSSNDWRVMARQITGSLPSGSPVQVSETNSMRPYSTACSFGTNFLVLWSADEGPWAVDTNIVMFGGVSNLWRPTVHGRMVSETGVPLRHEFSLLRYFHYNTNVAAAYENGRYLVTCYNSGMVQHVQPLDADGSRSEYPFYVFSGFWPEFRPRLASGAGRFCLAHALNGDTARAVVIGPVAFSAPGFTSVQRSNNSIAVTLSYPWSAIEVSTNLIDWELRHIAALSSLGGKPQLYVRLASHQRTCIENLRTIDWAKQQWAFSNFKHATDTPNDSDLFSLAFPKPACPHNGTYTLHEIATKPACNIIGHTL
jgi:hypothetical protein